MGGVPVDDVLACVLLTVFGLRTLASARDAEATAAEEKGEAEDEVEAFTSAAAATGVALSTFALVFAAEWGDKSFLATIALAAASDPAGVVLGAVAGHGVATALAVAGGGALASRVSEKAVAYLGGGLFLVFAAATAIDIVRGI
jgi:putative Ca2+/H+ antiporter (TMEM165/GDT1 family)